MLQWSLANPNGIQVDEAGQVWHAGRVNAVLPINNDEIVVGADLGGVWHISRQGSATALSHNWDNPDVLCLARGIGGNRHIFAGCGEYKGKGVLWMSDPRVPDPLTSWHRISFPNQGRGIMRILVLPQVGTIVVAAQRGLWSSPIPGNSNPLAYQFTQVTSGLPVIGSDVSIDIAEGLAGSVVAAIAGNGFFFGNWTSGVLRMQRATLPAAINQNNLQRTSIASGASNRNMMFAVSGHDTISALLSSTDGGATWQNLITQVIGSPAGTTVASQANNQGWHNQCISVSPVNSSVVGLGWRNEGPFISKDSGRTWQNFHRTNPAFHSDMQALSFTANGSKLYMSSDGGVTSADVVLGPPTQPFLQNVVSIHNRKLANLQFNSNPSHSEWGTFSVNDQFAAGGLHDNGNVYTRWKEQAPWRQSGLGDGQLTLLLNDRDLLFDNASEENHFRPTLTSWDGVRMLEKGRVPVLAANGAIIPNNDVTGPNAVSGLGSPRELVVELVRAPVLQSRINPNFRIRSIAGVGDRLYGLFGDNQPNIFYHWETLGLVPLEADDFITAVASYDGLIVFIGTNLGRMIRFNPMNRRDINIQPLNLGIIRSILTDASAPPVLSAFARTDNSVLQLINGSATFIFAGTWTVLGPVTTAAQTTIFDLVVDWSIRPARLYAATDTRVYTSLDGRRWDEVSQGLPETPHCSGLQITSSHIFLSTFGRSMWHASFLRTWSNEEDLSGLLTSDPAACTWGPGRVDIFYRGQNNRLWHRWFEGSWHAEEELGGLMSDTPAACTWGRGRIDVFYRGTNNHLWHRWLDQSWHLAEDLGGLLTSAPTACCWGPGRIDIFYRGQNNHLKHKWFDQNWHNEEDLGGVLTSAPTACTWGLGRVDIFYRGQNNHLWHKWFEGSWHNEEDLGGDLISAPSACTWGPGRIDIFYKGQNNHIWQRKFEGSWQNEEDRGGFPTGAPAACTWGVNRLDIFYRGQNQHLWHRWFPV